MQIRSEELDGRTKSLSGISPTSEVGGVHAAGELNSGKKSHRVRGISARVLECAWFLHGGGNYGPCLLSWVDDIMFVCAVALFVQFVPPPSSRFPESEAREDSEMTVQNGRRDGRNGKSWREGIIPAEMMRLPRTDTCSVDKSSTGG